MNIRIPNTIPAIFLKLNLLDYQLLLTMVLIAFVVCEIEPIRINVCHLRHYGPNMLITDEN